jgi:cytochrome c-type biogenesis protein CcmH
MLFVRLVVAIFCILTAQSAWAGPGLDPREQLADAASEARARALFKQLRCVVCQSESLDDSEADLARDMRRLIRDQITAGRSDQQIIASLTASYGEFVLLSPPARPSTWALWFGPFVLLAAVAGMVGWFLFGRRVVAQDQALSADEAEAVQDLRRNLPPG